MLIEDLELYAPVPDGYRLKGMRSVREGDFWLSLVDGSVKGPADVPVKRQDEVNSPDIIRMIVEKIKPKIKRSFRVDVLDERERALKDGESGIDRNGWFHTFNNRGTVSVFTPCIVTELEVEK